MNHSGFTGPVMRVEQISGTTSTPRRRLGGRVCFSRVVLARSVFVANRWGLVKKPLQDISRHTGLPITFRHVVRSRPLTSPRSRAEGTASFALRTRDLCPEAGLLGR